MLKEKFDLPSPGDFANWFKFLEYGNPHMVRYAGLEQMSDMQVFNLIGRDGRVWLYLPDEKRNEKKFFVRALLTTPSVYRFGTKEWRSDPVLFDSLVPDAWGSQILYAADELKDNPEFMFDTKHIFEERYFLNNLSARLKDDKTLVLEFLEKLKEDIQKKFESGEETEQDRFEWLFTDLAFSFSKRLCNSPKVMKKAMEISPGNFKFHGLLLMLNPFVYFPMKKKFNVWNRTGEHDEETIYQRWFHNLFLPLKMRKIQKEEE